MLEVRLMEEDDIEGVTVAVRSAHFKTLSKIYPDQLLEHWMQSKYDHQPLLERLEGDFTYWVALEEGRVIGIIGLAEDELRSFFVAADSQGRGVGRALYEALEAEARRRGITQIHLEGSPFGEPAYRAFGFRRIGTSEKEWEGIPYVDAVMVKDLV